MKTSKEKWSIGLSIVSIVVSLIVLSVVWSLNDQELLPDFSATAVTILGILVTILVAWQIYNTLQIDERLINHENDTKKYIDNQLEHFKERINKQLSDTISEIEEKQEELLKKTNAVSILLASARENRVYSDGTDVMSIQAFNNPNNLARQLSQIGVGTLNEWRNSISGVEWDEYMSITPYYVFGDGDMSKIQSNLSLYLVGKKEYAETLDVVLNYGHMQNEEEALSLFLRCIVQISGILNINIDIDWIKNSFDAGDQKDYGDFFLSLKKETFERMTMYNLSIASRHR